MSAEYIQVRVPISKFSEFILLQSGHIVDDPEGPRKRVARMVEQVIKHGTGHLRSSASPDLSCTCVYCIFCACVHKLHNSNSISIDCHKDLNLIFLPLLLSSFLLSFYFLSFFLLSLSFFLSFLFSLFSIFLFSFFLSYLRSFLMLYFFHSCFLILSNLFCNKRPSDSAQSFSPFFSLVFNVYSFFLSFFLFLLSLILL